MSQPVRVALVLILGLAGGVTSLMLLQHHYGEMWSGAAMSAVCGPADAGCDVVNRSAYAAVRGVPLAAVGLVFYLSLASMALLAWLAGGWTAPAALRVGLFLVAAALAVDLVLLGVQVFSLRAFCKACLLTYAMNLGLFFLLRQRVDTPPEEASLARRLLVRSKGRTLLGGWFAATLLAAGMTYGIYGWLKARKVERAQEILGDRVAGDVTGLRAEVARLQQTLDDPARRARYDAEKAISEFEKSPVHSLDLKRAPFKGPADAAIAVVEFSDFLCPFCRSIAAAFNGYLPQSGGRVRILFKNFPLDRACNEGLQQTIHPGACLLAIGAICAHDQGKFWPYHDRVFGTEVHDPRMADVVRIAEQAGLDKTRFEACVAAPASLERVKEEVAEGQRIGVNATPTLFINGKKVSRIDDFLELVNREARRLGLPVVTPSPPGSPAPSAR